jgi:diguanylate cyclase (GGDEF)-like protein
MNRLMMFEKEKAVWLTTTSFLAIPVIGIADFLTGPTITFALIYLLPVSAIAWLSTRSAMLLAAVLTIVIWITVDFISGRFPPSLLTYTWNFSSRLIVLETITILLSELKRALLDARELAHRDPLTDALNSRMFLDLAEHEVLSSARSGTPLTMVYLDVDNFKTINDTFGHNTGDTLLVTIVQTIRLHARKSDLVGRLGGDEFAILLADTGPESARAFVAKIRKVLLDVTARRNWPVTLSIGVLTCMQMPASVEALIGMADKLMYTIKGNAKDGIAFSIFPKSV